VLKLGVALKNLIKELRDEADGAIDAKPDECYRDLMYAAADALENFERINKVKDLDNKYFTDRVEELTKEIEELKSKAIFLEVNTIKELSKYADCYAPLLREVALACDNKINNKLEYRTDMKKNIKHANIKNKISIALIGLLSVVAIGCSSGETSTPVEVTTTTTAKVVTPTTLKQSTLTDIYVDIMQERYPSASRTTLIELGQSACDVIEMYGSVSAAIVGMAQDPEFAEMATDIGYTFGVAVPVFCPKYKAEIDRIANS